jgi:sulfite reductase (NADPH) flavoprotein alpha-component
MTMLEEIKLKELNQFVEKLTREELVWLNGYVAGLVKGQPVTQAQATSGSAGKITIAFGTETGNSKKLATSFAAKARKQGLSVKLASLDQYRLSDLSKEENFITIISTHGEGEPPAAAKKFIDHIRGNQLSLDRLQYSVLALGDSAYPLFCKAGEDVDAHLGNQGAKRIYPLQKCDVDFEADANQWFEQVISLLQDSRSTVIAPKVSAKPSGRKTYSGTILSKTNLNGKGSSKETYHIEIAADGLTYEPGDSIGIIPKNPEREVESITQWLGLTGVEKISYKNEEHTLSHLLKNRLNIFYLPERVVAKYASIVQQEIPVTRMDFINLLKIYPPKKEQAEEVIRVLEPIAPRLYSISSSLTAHADEVHITVARDKFELDGDLRYGLCSDYLSSLPQDAEIEFYVHKNSQFKLPAPDRDIIMIGPGTGVAPFRAFVEERANTGASGRNWLFFGDQHFQSDFLYQTEWQDYFKTGVLTKFNAAFSRDQKERVYVQHKMSKQSEELYRWIETGACVYVCGAKDTMSVDVENTLQDIIRVQGSKSQEEAGVLLQQMAEEGRYLKDVY